MRRCVVLIGSAARRTQQLIPAAGVVVAAGSGRRMGGESKQFRLLDGRPCFCWAVRAMLEALSGPVVAVLPADEIDRGDDLLRVHLESGASRLETVAGGRLRSDSVCAGLRTIGDADAVLVHDAARPFASAGLVERVARRAIEGRVVIPALSIDDTLKEIDGDRVVGTSDRGRFVRAQTPQGFPTAMLRAAHDEAPTEGVTDDAQLCERLGAAVFWIEGETLNRKLTDEADWTWAETRVELGEVRWT